MIEAVRGVAALGSPASESLLRRLADSDPSLKVRQAALVALRAPEE